MNWIRWTILAQLVFFAGWAVSEEWKQHAAPMLLLETEPVDPRDFLSGHYMDLSYKIRRVSGLEGYPKGTVGRRKDIAVRLSPRNNVTIGGKQYAVYDATAMAEAIPAEVKKKPGSDIWVHAALMPDGQADYGINRYYFSEKRKEELNKLRPGQFYVRVVVGRDGQLKVKNLVW